MSVALFPTFTHTIEENADFCGKSLSGAMSAIDLWAAARGLPTLDSFSAPMDEDDIAILLGDMDEDVTPEEQDAADQVGAWHDPQDGLGLTQALLADRDVWLHEPIASAREDIQDLNHLLSIAVQQNMKWRLDMDF